ncbi:MAG: hypothetical protein K8S98_03790 [Planctomycetes bacterium]|nr:hypothetical protein [Planctomycetota bacterium]
MRISLCAALLGAVLLGFVGSLASTFVVRASTVEQLDLAGLFDRSEHVVHGRVAKKSVLVDVHGRPETEYELALTRTFWGGAANVLVFRTPGGAFADGRELVIPGLPSLAVGEEVLLFLTHESRAGLRLPVGLAQGKFQVVRDAHGAATLLRGESDLEVLDPVTKEPKKLSTLASLGFDATALELERLAKLRRDREAAAKK